MIPHLYEAFKNWSAEGRVFVLSDLHFEDPDCKLMAENWPTPQEQIKIINNKVYKNDTLIILGDIGNPQYIKQLRAGYKILIAGNHDMGLSNYKKEIFYEKKVINIKYDTEEQYNKDMKEAENIFRKELLKKYPYSKINVKYCFDFYNPFEWLEGSINNNLFDEVYGGPLFISNKVLLSHEPIDLPFVLNIHGHTHAEKGYLYNDNHYNVCSNCVQYEPQDLSKIIKTGALKTIPSIHRVAIEKASENPFHKKLAK